MDVITLSFERPPPIRLLPVMLHRPKRDRDWVMPPIQAEITRATLDVPEDYVSLCRFASAEQAQLTWPHILATGMHLQMAAHPQMPLPATGLVHVRNTIRAWRPLPDGMPVRLKTEITGHTLVRSGVEVAIKTTALVDDDVVWEETSVALSRAVKGDGSPKKTPPPPLGTLARSVAWRLPENLGRKYARISGDYNPIHLSALTARPFGFRRAIIHGMWTKARCLAQLDLRAPCEIAVHFLRPASLPSAVYFNADQDGRFEVISARSSKRLLVGEARAPEE